MSNFILVWYMLAPGSFIQTFSSDQIARRFVQNLYGFALLVSPLVVITMGFFWFTRDARAAA